MLPENLLLVRHGESVGNVAMNAAKQGDVSFFTDEYVNTPGRAWPLSARGQEQARTIGAWLRKDWAEGFFAESGFHHHRRHYVSPLTRTQQTARFMDLRQVDNTTKPSVKWYLNRSIRERDWGEIETMVRDDYRQAYPQSAHKEKIDPLYWRPPGGESVADVAENRVRNFFDTLHRECSSQDVLAVSHGEFIRAVLLMLTRANDETYLEWEKDDAMRIKNCEVFHFTRRVPTEEFLSKWEKPGDERHSWPVRDRLAYFRRAYPTDITGRWTIVESEWEAINYDLPTNEELL